MLSELSMRSKRRSKPTVDRQSGVGSKVLIATSSVEQHGYEGRPKSRRPHGFADPEWAIGDFDLGRYFSPSRGRRSSSKSVSYLVPVVRYRADRGSAKRCAT